MEFPTWEDSCDLSHRHQCAEQGQDDDRSVRKMGTVQRISKTPEAALPEGSPDVRKPIERTSACLGIREM